MFSFYHLSSGRTTNIRFVIDENINQTGVSFFAIFDGHGGEFAAVFAKDYLLQHLYTKIIETSDILKGKQIPASPVAGARYSHNTNSDCGETNASIDNQLNINNKSKDEGTQQNSNNNNNNNAVQRRSSFKKSYSTAEDCVGGNGNCNREQDVFMDKINSLVRTKDSLLKTNNNNAPAPPPKTYQAKCYIENGQINFGKMISDEVLAADYKLIETAKRAVCILMWFLL